MFGLNAEPTEPKATTLPTAITVCSVRYYAFVRRKCQMPLIQDLQTGSNSRAFQRTLSPWK
jgi:hypothetical protein